MNRDKKKEKWAEIGKLLTPECNGDAAYLQWKRVKDMYDTKKRNASKKKSGAAADEYLKKWTWSEQLSFLDKVRVVAEPLTSMPPPLQPSGSGTQSNSSSTEEQSQNGVVLSQFPPTPSGNRKRSGRTDDSVQDLAKKVLLNLNAKLEQCAPKASKNAFAELMVARLDELEQLTDGTFREQTEGRLLQLLSQTKSEAVAAVARQRTYSPACETGGGAQHASSQVQVLLPTQQETEPIHNFIPVGTSSRMPVYKQVTAASAMHPFSPDSTEDNSYSAAFDDAASEGTTMLNL